MKEREDIRLDHFQKIFLVQLFIMQLQSHCYTVVSFFLCGLGYHWFFFSVSGASNLLASISFLCNIRITRLFKDIIAGPET